MSHEATTDNPYTRGIAEFVSGLKYDAIPAEVRHRIKLLMLDALGCALYGADLEWCHILQDALSRLDTTRECGVWGTKKKLSAPHAALAHYDHGRCLFQSGRIDEAVKAFERSLELQPDYFYANFALGLIRRESGDRQSAARHLRRAVEAGTEVPRELVRQAEEALKGLD